VSRIVAIAIPEYVLNWFTGISGRKDHFLYAQRPKSLMDGQRPVFGVREHCAVVQDVAQDFAGFFFDRTVVGERPNPQLFGGFRI